MKSFLAVVASFALVLTPGVVLAYSNFGSDWEAAHPGFTSFASASCDLCHSASSQSEWNAYGYAVRTEYLVNGGDMPAAIATVDAQNSDGDPAGATNVLEAAANAQPGWTAGPNNTIYDASGVVATGQLPPTGIRAIDPVTPVTVVSISDTAFSPAAVAPTLGGYVLWVRGSGSLSHNVAEVHGIFSSGAATTGAIWYTRSVSAGTFSYLDKAHTAMKGTIKVKPKTAAAPIGNPFTVTWATTKTNTGTKFNVQYRTGTGVWKSWRMNTSLKKAVFGASGKPIIPKAGTTYGFRVQSGTGTVWSGYSPIKTFTP